MEVAALLGMIRQDREIGLVVSSGGFSAQAVAETPVRASFKYLDRILALWEANYDKLSEEDQNLLRLRRVPFLAPEQTGAQRPKAYFLVRAD